MATLIAMAMSVVAAAQQDKKVQADLRLFDAEKGVWYSISADGSSMTGVKLGGRHDVAVPADFDGDGLADPAVWKPATGTWMIRRTSDSRSMIFRFGQGRAKNGADVPFAADLDGDGLADAGVWIPNTGEWRMYSSKSGVETSMGVLGYAGDIPVVADYDGDKKADLAVFRPSENRWVIQSSKTGEVTSKVFGNAATDTLVPADYTGDGKADIAVYNAGKWSLINSSTGAIEPFEFGFADDVAAPADYDGDGVTDFATYRKGTWYVYDSGKPRFHTFDLGTANGVPVSSLSNRKVSP